MARPTAATVPIAAWLLAALALNVCCLSATTTNTATTTTTDPTTTRPAIDPEVRRVIEQIAANESKIQNLMVEGELWWEERRPDEPDWHRTPMMQQGVVWRDGQLNGRARLEMHRMVCPWIDGPSSYSVEQYSESYDGKLGRRASHATGHFEKPMQPYRRGGIVAKRPSVCTGPAGTQYTNLFMYEGMSDASQAMTLSQSLAEAAEKGMIRVGQDQLDGRPCVRITSIVSPSVRLHYWLDPARGYAFLGSRVERPLADGRLRFSQEVKVHKLVEAAPGIWYPVEVTEGPGAWGVPSAVPAPEKSSTSGEPEPLKRVQFRAYKVVVNDPAFDEAVFTLTFPSGYFIVDQVQGTQYKVP